MMYNWIENLTNATTLLGWTIEDFWAATPRMYYACFYSYVKMHVNASKKASKQKALVGSDAIDALTRLVRYIR